MIIVRPVTQKDHKAVLAMAKQAGIGMTSLPPDTEVLSSKINDAVLSFQDKPIHPEGHNFLFVLEDTETRKIVGSTGIVAHVGIMRPFYSYKLSTIVQASHSLGIYSLQRVLHMVNDYTGVSEIGSLFLMPEYRRDGIGRFLSRSRYLLLAEFPHLFADIVISEIRGVQDRNGNSPFYDNLARSFFQMEFRKADYINATQGGQFIADLMPKYPIYVNLLPKKAQDVIGEPLKASGAAMKLLEKEGFRHTGYIDVFDGGPTLQVERKVIKTVRESRRLNISRIEDVSDKPEQMISNTVLDHFRITRAPMGFNRDGSVSISKETAKELQLKVGDPVRYAPT